MENKTITKEHTPPFPKQSLSPPGIEEKMNPKPVYLKKDYQASEKLKDKVALISGGDSGIGRSVAAHFALEGADVAFTYLPEEETDATATQKIIEDLGAIALPIPIDLTQENACETVVETVMRHFDHIDILVNNAAFQNHLDDFDELSVEQFEHTFDVNVFSHFKLVKAAMNCIRKGGCIINTTSVLSYLGDKNLIDYSASKGALHTMTKSLAKAFSSRGVRVNAVAPGPVWTPLNPAERKYEEVKNFGKDTEFGRPAQPAEIAPAYVYLASDVTGSYITGETINIFGDSLGAN